MLKTTETAQVFSNPIVGVPEPTDAWIIRYWIEPNDYYLQGAWSFSQVFTDDALAKEVLPSYNHGCLVRIPGGCSTKNLEVASTDDIMNARISSLETLERVLADGIMANNMTYGYSGKLFQIRIGDYIGVGTTLVCAAIALQLQRRITKCP